MSSNLKPRLSPKAAVTITRSAIKNDKLVYIAIANKPMDYNDGKRSRIVYIGTTQAGAKRIAQSAASKAENLLKEHGVKSLDFYTVSSKLRQGLKS
ncbi:MAG: hypothetical protein EPO24_12920 [Bacteroidetes bacterium]|nr:MAG: hypothetical protein EPO24_12920 [Bacteroidota bacterium]